MEDTAFKKDETPYLIFVCKKCKEYSYVKTTQKTKKYLRCGRIHQVRDILKDGEVVYGMTEAVNTVKRRQNELAIPEFRSGSDFVVSTNVIAQPKRSTRALRIEDQDIDYRSKFNEMLSELSKLYRRFPKYLLEIMAEDYEIPLSELDGLLNEFKQSKMLIAVREAEFYFKIIKK